MKKMLLLLLPIIGFGQVELPNGIRIGDSLYLDATEVSNIHWFEFEYFVKQDSSEEYHQSILPDTMILSAFRTNYYRNPYYRYFPLVGVTYWQAKEYCKWRSHVVSSTTKDQGYLVRYRLPKEQEWEDAAKTIDSVQTIKPQNPSIVAFIGDKSLMQEYFGDTVNLKKLKKELRMNRKLKSPAFIVFVQKPWYFLSEDYLPSHVFYPDTYDLSHSKRPKPKKLYNLIGNVAEMVEEKGLVKGGSWRHMLDESFPSQVVTIDSKKAYDWVGFRCIAEIIPISD